jgi:UDP-N-acetylmuramate: L-alanyl-gamma-D-glutamyl-meso-diaminopimelate ligase
LHRAGTLIKNNYIYKLKQSLPMKVHFIAIGGSAMHNLAIALHKGSWKVTGSDDEIFDPSRQRLQQYGLLPETQGWFPERITSDLDAIILGMHAREDNPELARARELGLPIYSYPEFLYRQSASKTRIVIGGSHGKTTITAMVLHVLNHCRIETDYMVGAQLEGFDVMVKLTEDAPYMVMEGDEYLSSPIDRRPKFHLYKPHIALISGIAWDHINVFPTFENYLEQFRLFIDAIENGGKLIWCTEDEHLRSLAERGRQRDLCLLPYGMPEYRIEGDRMEVVSDGQTYPMQVFGRHNLLNMNGARTICMQLGVASGQFYEAMGSFAGASNRLQLAYDRNGLRMYRDFAHAPSKLRATVKAVKEFFPDKKLLACMELHTFSSLNKNFLDQYKGSMDEADQAMVFYSPHALQMKRLPALDPAEVAAAFQKPGIRVFTAADDLLEALETEIEKDSILLFMSSGSFGGLDTGRLVEAMDRVAG